MEATLTDLLEVKKILQIPLTDTSQDYALNYYITTVTNMIGEFLDRPNLYLQERTEYYNGTGTQKLPLRSRPVLADPEPQVWEDEAGSWGEAENAFSGTALEFGNDFGLWLDTTNPASGVMDKSRCGILVKKRSYWFKPTVRQQGFLSPFIGPAFGNIKVVYTGGYALNDLPPMIRMAAIQAVGRWKYLMPISVPISSESYEERHITFSLGEKNYLFGQVKHLLFSMRNWTF